MTVNMVMRVAATICFGLATFGVGTVAVGLVPLGLTLWCGSTLVNA